MFSSLFASNVAEFPDAGSYVGARGFEPPTSWSRTTRSTKLSYAPNMQRVVYHVFRSRASWDRTRLALPPSTPNSARAVFPLRVRLRFAGSHNQLLDRVQSARPRNISILDAKNRARSRSRPDALQTTPSV